jgi:hypothetical protein
MNRDNLKVIVSVIIGIIVGLVIIYVLHTLFFGG